jgi:integrase
VRELFNFSKLQETWGGDLKHYTLNLLSASTGMRLGECQALQNQHVRDGYVNVWYSWGRKYGLKTTKNKERRSVPIPKITQSCLQELMTYSPYQDPEDFVFWGIHGKKPVDQRTISEVLYAAFKKVGISKKERIQRNITFHSWRYFFNSYFRTRIPQIKLRRLTGHKSERMTDHYTQFKLEDFTDVVEMQEEFFMGNVENE